ncbi:sharpin isoform X2 [Gopherus flavomarginatus]|uniref:sharpin isoform X2 n=1 Tax=Gopherus flavomarginatus TaxID=286002 RepID=UPI0021CC4C2F|nr:sharpin isoform X2 [Gopherus flavomarginatus]
MALPGAPAPGPPGGPAPPPTVLMSVRVWAARPLGLLPPPAGASAAGDALLRLQLSVRPGPAGGRLFRLALRHTDARRSVSIAEYNLKDISYTVKNASCHELMVLSSSDDPMVFHFEDEREAQKWWTVVSSSLREVQKAAESPSVLVSQLAPLPSGSGNALPVLPSDASHSLELSNKEELALRLARAIELGDEQAASQCAMALARQQASLHILLKESSYPANEIRMKVGVEDAMCSANITIRVHARMTIGTLRQQVFQDYGFHPSVQRWIIGQCLCMDDRTIGSYGIRKDGDTAFLYLLSAKKANLSEQRCEEDQAMVMLPLAPSLPDSSGTDEKRKYSTLPNVAPKKAWVADNSEKMNIGETSRQLGMLQLTNPLPSQSKAPPAAAPPPSPVQTGWSCAKCTFINKPTRPGCEMCSTDRPVEYMVPGSYQPDETELWRMQQEEKGILQYQQSQPQNTFLPEHPWLLQLPAGPATSQLPDWTGPGGRTSAEFPAAAAAGGEGAGAQPGGHGVPDLLPAHGTGGRGAAPGVSAQLLQRLPAAGDQLQPGTPGVLPLPRQHLRLQQQAPGTGGPGAGVSRGIQAVPGAGPGGGGETHPEQLSLQNPGLQGLVHLRGHGQ